jgi:hypothetical protein
MLLITKPEWDKWDNAPNETTTMPPSHSCVHGTTCQRSQAQPTPCMCWTLWATLRKELLLSVNWSCKHALPFLPTTLPHPPSKALKNSQPPFCTSSASTSQEVTANQTYPQRQYPRKCADYSLALPPGESIAQIINLIPQNPAVLQYRRAYR